MDKIELRLYNLEFAITSILFFGILYTINTALFALYINTQSDKRLERIEKLLKKESVPVVYTGYAKIEEV